MQYNTLLSQSIILRLQDLGVSCLLINYDTYRKDKQNCYLITKILLSINNKKLLFINKNINENIPKELPLGHKKNVVKS